MKNRSLIITLIVLLSIIAILLTIFLIYALTEKDFLFEYTSGINSKNVILEKDYSINEIEKLDITSDAGEVKILESEDDNIKLIVYGKSSKDLNNIKTFENRDKSLNLEVLGERNKFINFGFRSFDIVIYAPKEALKEIKINNDLGDIEIENFEEASISLDQDCGDIDIGKVKNVTIKSSYGDVKIVSISNKCNIDSDCGDIKIDNLQINENSLIKSDLGDVKIEKVNDVYIDAKTDLGDTKVSSNNRHSEITLTIENDCGDIKVNN